MSNIGVDLVDCKRIKEKALKNDKFVQNLLTDGERMYLSTKPLKTAKNNEIEPYFQTLAGFFATKEAVLKALGIGLTKGIKFQEIEVLHYESGQPYVVLYGSIKEMFENENYKNISVSISHDSYFAIAVVNID